MQQIPPLEGLDDPDPDVRDAAAEECRRFQTASGFTWNIFLQLADRQSNLKYRVFAHTSISLVIGSQWLDIPPELKSAILASFPFTFGNPPDKDPLCRLIAHTCAVFIASVATNNDVDAYFTKIPLDQPLFMSTFIAELVWILLPTGTPHSRLFTLSSFLSRTVPEYFCEYILKLLVCCDTKNSFFSYLVYILSETHQNCPKFVEKFVSDEETLPAYLKLANLVWLNSDDQTIAALFDSILDIPCVPKVLIDQMVNSCVNSFLQQYRLLFQKTPISTEQFDTASQAFKTRLQIFFTLFDLQSNDFEDLFGIAIFVLNCQTPSIVSEAATQLTSLLQSSKFDKDSELSSELKPLRLKIVEVCLGQLVRGYQNLQNVALDLCGSKSLFIASLTDTVVAVYMHDPIDVLQGLFDLIPSSLNKPLQFIAINRLLSRILQSPSPALSILPQLALSTTILILSAINTLDNSLQARACNFLMKLLPFIQLSDDDATKFFMALLDLLLDNRPCCYSAFSGYFNMYTTKFENNITFPISFLQTITKRNPAFSVVTELLSRIEKPVENDQIGGLSMHIEWFVYEFTLDDPASNRRMNVDLADAMSKLSDPKFQLSGNPQNIPRLLVLLSNRVLQLATTDNSALLSQLTSLVSKMAPAFARFTQFYTQFMEAIMELDAPTLLSNLTRLWIERIASPLLTTLYPLSSDLVQIVSSRVLTQCVQLIRESMNSNEAIKAAIALCPIAEISQTDVAVEYFNTALELNDQRVFRQCLLSLAKLPITLVAAVFPMISKQKDTSSIERIAEMLLEIFNKAGQNIQQFRIMPGFTDEIIETLGKRLKETKNPKSWRRSFKKALTQVY